MTIQQKSSAVSLRGISRVYGRGPAAVRAVDGVDLDFPRGGWTAVMGPSGSGKSSLLDSAAAHTVLDLLRSMADGAQSIVMVTHGPAAAARADAVVFLRDGRVVDRLTGAGPREVADRLVALER